MIRAGGTTLFGGLLVAVIGFLLRFTPYASMGDWGLTTGLGLAGIGLVLLIVGAVVRS